MTNKEKQILLIDLCGRLLYGVMCYCKWTKNAPNGTKGCVQELSTFVIDEIEMMDNPEYDCQICEVKPYLRPMDSMTEEEKENYYNLCTKEWDVHIDDYWYYDNYKSYDWLNANHFDYHTIKDKDGKEKTMIEYGLAIEATEGMYSKQ